MHRNAFAHFAGQKVRPIDDMTASGINAATGAQEKMSYDTLDLFLESLRQLKARTEVRFLVTSAWREKVAAWLRMN